MMSRSIVRMLPLCALAILAFAGIGCSKRHRISIQSDSCWIVVIDKDLGAVSSDCGNQNFRVAGEIHCVAITNRDTLGFVRVRIDDGPWAENALPLGTAEICR